jgi:hypothetical protein
VASRGGGAALGLGDGAGGAAGTGTATTSLGGETEVVGASVVGHRATAATTATTPTAPPAIQRHGTCDARSKVVASGARAVARAATPRCCSARLSASRM